MILVFADDLTGALEAGALFAASGHPSRVFTKPVSVPLPSVEVLIFDTQTRHFTPAQAQKRIGDLVAQLPRTLAGTLIYKKTDSTLRGNIGPEIAALQAWFPDREVLYVPAYPALGRTARDGKLLLAGAPIHKSEFAADALNPVATSTLSEVLHPATGRILDGETEDDVRLAAAEVAQDPGRFLVAGPAAIARHLATHLPAVGTQPGLPLLGSTRLLVVNGSRHPASLAQLAHARAHACLNDGRWREFFYAGGQSGLERASQVGAEVATILHASAFDGILVFGGDTAHGIYAALGETFLDPLGEVWPGVPVSRSSSGLLWVTKAGGFGPEDLIARLMQNLPLESAPFPK